MICDRCEQASAAKQITFPELGLSGYLCTACLDEFEMLDSNQGQVNLADARTLFSKPPPSHQCH